MYTTWLNGDDRIRIWIKAEKGKVVSFLVAYETKINEKWYAVIHYDTYHGFPHKDVIYPDGRQKKEKLPNLELKDLVLIAIRDIEENWVTYRKRFEGWLNG